MFSDTSLSPTPLKADAADRADTAGPRCSPSSLRGMDLHFDVVVLGFVLFEAERSPKYRYMDRTVQYITCGRKEGLVLSKIVLPWFNMDDPL